MTRVRIVAPLAHRDFRRLWSGLVISLLGDGIFFVAVAWQAYALDNRPSALALVGVFAAAPQVLLLLVGGVISDRIPRRTILVTSDLARGAALALLAVIGWSGALQLWHLCIAAIVIGAGAAFAAPAFDAIVPELVAEEELQHANGLDQFLRPVALRLIGPALGGVLVAVAGSSGAFAIDAASFVFSAWCLSRISPPSIVVAADTDSDDETTSLWADLREGLHYVRSNVWLWGTFVAATFSYLLFLGPTEVLLPYLVKNQLHGGAGSLGFVLGAGGVGALAAAAIVGQRDSFRRPITFMYVAWGVATLLVAGYGIATQTWQLAVLALVINGFEAAGTVAWVTLKQHHVPREMLGRVSSIDWFVSTSLTPLSYALTPVAAAVLGVRTTLVVAGLLGAVVTIGFLFLPGMRRHDHAPEVPESVDPVAVEVSV
jgi:MFS family permease